MPKPTLTTSLRYLSYVLALLSFVYVYKIAKDVDITLPRYTASTYVLIPLLCFAYAVFPFVSAYMWKLAVELISRKPMTFKEAFGIYLKSNIGKYLPGNVMQYVGRNYVGVRYGWQHAHLAFGSVLEVALLVAIPFSMLIGFYLSGLWVLPESYSLRINIVPSGAKVLIVVVILSAALALLWILAKKNVSRIHKLVQEYDARKFFPQLGMLVLKVGFLAVTTMLAYAVLFYALAANLLGIHFRTADFTNLACSLTVANYAGILTPGVPGGLGVKESMSTLFVSAYGYDRASVVVVLIVARAFSVVGDVIAFLVATAFMRDQQS